MRRLVLCAILALLCQSGTAQHWMVPIPPLQQSLELTPSKFPNADAVILTKAESFRAERVSLFGSYTLPAVMRTSVKIIKLFNDAAIKRYGTFEFSYSERLFSSEFRVDVRILKPTGRIVIVPDSLTSNTVSRRTSSGTPLRRTVLLKIPDLAPGDMVQIQYVYREPLTYLSGGQFIFEEEDPVIACDFYLTFLKEETIHYRTYPAGSIPAPRLIGASHIPYLGDIHNWKLTNLPAIPKEPHAPPRDRLAHRLAYFVTDTEDTSSNAVRWNELGKNYWKEYIDDGSGVKGKRVKQIGMGGEIQWNSFASADSLYTCLRRAITLQPHAARIPASDDIDEIFEKRLGDATDLSYIMYKILEDNDVTAHLALLSDRRDPPFDPELPSLVQFDRLGVIAEIGGTRKLYDFDAAIPGRYQMPWFLDSTVALILREDSVERFLIRIPSADAQNVSVETHALSFPASDILRDTAALRFRGAPALELREDMIGHNTEDINRDIHAILERHIFAKADTVGCNEFTIEPEVMLTGCGILKTAPTVIDTFITLRLPCHVLNDLKEWFSVPKRRSDLVLGQPLTYSIIWNIAMPSGFTVRQSPPPADTSSPAGITSAIAAAVNETTLRITAEIAFPTGRISAAQYPAAREFFNRIAAKIEKDIILVKR